MGTEIDILISLVLGAIVIVALLHLGFMVLEATQWFTPLRQRLTHLSESAARETAGVGVNIGLYNGFLGLAYVWGGRDLRAVAPRSDSANFPGFFSILCSVFRDSVVTIFRVIS